MSARIVNLSADAKTVKMSDPAFDVALEVLRRERKSLDKRSRGLVNGKAVYRSARRLKYMNDAIFAFENAESKSGAGETA